MANEPDKGVRVRVVYVRVQDVGGGRECGLECGVSASASASARQILGRIGGSRVYWEHTFGTPDVTTITDGYASLTVPTRRIWPVVQHQTCTTHVVHGAPHSRLACACAVLLPVLHWRACACHVQRCQCFIDP